MAERADLRSTRQVWCPGHLLSVISPPFPLISLYGNNSVDPRAPSASRAFLLETFIGLGPSLQGPCFQPQSCFHLKIHSSSVLIQCSLVRADPTPSWGRGDCEFELGLSHLGHCIPWVTGPERCT